MQYDPKSRPTFIEIIKKLNIISDKLFDGTAMPNAVQSKSPIALTNCTSESQNLHNSLVKHNAESLYNNSQQSNNNNNNTTNFHHHDINNVTKRNSMDANFTTTPHSSESSEEDDESVRLRNGVTTGRRSFTNVVPLQHRRSLSENVILFPPHTTPSDKARCHMLNRQGSKSIFEEESPTIDMATVEYPSMPPNVSLRKVAETMFLKDPQYKPRLNDPAATKSNPFTALAQLRGVKKILGANPSTYTAGVGDLFSSCFEMSSPFLKELSIFQKLNSKTNGDVLPKSLPASPTSVRRDFANKIDKVVEEKVLKAAAAANNCSKPMTNGFATISPLAANVVNAVPVAATAAAAVAAIVDEPIINRKNVDVVSEHDSGDDQVFDEEETLELDPLKSTGTIKKFKANSLFSHPLFKNGNAIGEKICKSELNDSIAVGSSNEVTAADIAIAVDNEKHESGSSTASSENFDNPKLYIRRGSSESGFFSCLNEDFSTPPYTRQQCCCIDKLKTHLNLDAQDRVTMCRCCCIYSNTTSHQMSCTTLNDASSILMMDDCGGGGGGGSAVSSLRSLDDLELSDSLSNNNNNNNKHRLNCRHVFSNLDIDARSIDMGLINRLALDSEINSFIQRNPYTNQLLYCKNRTSSIYTDSSDDISSLAGSDSLMWDDRNYTTIPNARSAQIAKIVEYFERKGQSFVKSFNVPDTFRTGGGSVSSYHRHHSNNGGSGNVCNGVSVTSLSSPFNSGSSNSAATVTTATDCFTDIRSDYPFSGSNRKFVDYKSRATAAEYEAFCMELDKRPPQQRLMVCEGAVKSKLQIFDKLNSKERHQHRE